MRNLVSIEDMPRESWERLIAQCRAIIKRPEDFYDSCRGKVVASLFYEPSTRTNFSFQSAIKRLGGSVIGFSNPAGTSVSKGENLADTVRIAASYSDTVIIRSPYEGAAAVAALYSDVPVINAGDGGHFHPTQTLTDLATISYLRNSPEGLNIGFCGDLKYGRTVHSLISALSMFGNVNFCLISPKDLRVPDYVRRGMEHNSQIFRETENLHDAIGGLDILYMTRIQRERFRDYGEYERYRGVYVLTKKLMESAKHDMLIMHPLPRIDEIDRAVDSDSRAVYFGQARYGMFIRMALLLDFCHMPKIMPKIENENSVLFCGNPSCITSTENYLPKMTTGDNRCGYCDKPIARQT